MASLNDFRLHQPTMTSISDAIVNSCLVIANLWEADQISQGSVYSAFTKTRATTFYVLSLVADGLAFDAAQGVGTIKLQDRGEETIPKDACQALQGMSGHYSNQAKALIAESLTDPTTLEKPDSVGIAWSF